MLISQNNLNLSDFMIWPAILIILCVTFLACTGENQNKDDDSGIGNPDDDSEGDDVLNDDIEDDDSGLDDDEDDNLDDDLTDDDIIDDDTFDDDTDDDTADNDSFDDDSADDDSADDDIGDDDSIDDDASDDDSAIFWSENFDEIPIGPLPAPWIVEEHNATISVVALKAGSGHVMEIDDPAGLIGYGASARIDLSEHPEINSAFIFEYEMRMLSGNALGFAWYENYFGAYLEDFYIDFESTKLTTLSGSGVYQTCAYFDPSQWHLITVQIDPVNHDYSVLLDGATTYCNDMQFIYSLSALCGVAWFGYESQSWFGNGQVDHLSGRTTE